MGLKSSVDFDLSNESYYLLLALGPVDGSKGNIGYHTGGQLMSGDKVNLAEFSPNPCNPAMFLYDLPIGSFKPNSSGVSARWVATDRDWYCLELKANLSASSYMALGFSMGGMGPAPVVACSADDPFQFPLYWNTAWSSAPAYNSTADIQTTVNTTGGTTTCYIAISSNFYVFPKSSSSAPEQFDLNFTPYHLAAASGPVKNGTLK